jgi:GTPase SAR1 family protein
MFNRPAHRVSQQLELLSQRLAEENPALQGVLEPFKVLDRIGYAAGLLDPVDESYAFTLSWWPMIAVLGTFSAGKSTFINEFIGRTVQRSGSQAVDDRFTVIAYGPSERVAELPGLALDGDPRFPFYRVSDEIERLSSGGGRTVDQFLAMKTVASEALRGRILIDSPGFDADEQRATILQLTDHIIDLSDLVLVFFDARHPEPGAMRDTLEHLVSRVASRNDFQKLVFILNQIDTTWREDNLEEVVAAWQRAVVRQGTTTGRFYCLYNEGAAVEIRDPGIRERYAQKVARDRQEIHGRMAEISSSRSYRIVGSLQAIAEALEKDAVPALTEAMGRWRRRVVWADALTLAGLLTVLVYFLPGLMATSSQQPVLLELGGGLPIVDAPLSVVASGTLFGHSMGLAIVSGLILVIVWIGLHFFHRRWIAQRIARHLPTETPVGNWRRAFLRNTRIWHSVFRTTPAGLGGRTRRQLQQLREQSEQFVRRLNDQFMQVPAPATTEPADAMAGAAAGADLYPSSHGTSSGTVPPVAADSRPDAGR